MLTGLTARKQRTMMALGLLVFWLFAQGNLIAHELIESHIFDQTCEWHCHSKGQDNDLLITTDSPVWCDNYRYEFTLQHSYIYTLTPHQIPYLRGPPN